MTTFSPLSFDERRGRGGINLTPPPTTVIEEGYRCELEMQLQHKWSYGQLKLILQKIDKFNFDKIMFL